MSIFALHTELWELIATHVDAGSLGSLRLTSRFFYDCTLEVFAERVANKRWLLRAASLDTLRAAASKPYLNKRLTTFRLGTHSLASWIEHPDEPHWRDTWDAELREQHFLTWRRRESNERMGHGAMILANALNDLQALHKIEIGEWCAAGKGFQIGHGGNEARNGTAQHLNAFYRSASMYTQGVLYDGRPELTILDPLDRNNMRSCLSEDFQHVLHALTIMKPGPGAKPLESLSAVLYDSRTRILHGALTDEMQKLKEGSSTFKALQPALAHLRELSLAIEVDGRHWVYSKTNSRPETWLSVFMKLVPSLEALELFHDDRFDDGQSWAYHQSLRLFFRDT